MKKIGKTSAKKSVKATSKATAKARLRSQSITLTGETHGLACDLARLAGVTPEEAIRKALAACTSCKFTATETPKGKKAVFIPEKAYANLKIIADTLNAGSKCGGQDNTPEGVFLNLCFDSDLEHDPSTVMDGILEGLDFLPEKIDGRTAADEKTMASRKAALVRRASKIKWA
jgi:hypothetical protein